ncbi:Glycosyltransferase, GT2 family [Acetitomaculum ruminis DSM 5522]|uniref:Glycosyltransferase, GT2 family n=1 Tax=Acetitomaculum ruminis DSM 5522 TaxID=1120918 RepID=A0A1I0Z0Y1_9FIRM|nr:glycosyltransferase family 2 protein [Acetitomaculum ruminis]SFB19201.1 Glycosyltransferase, GT2 family [Acetitomaculum ruminis DSM 5522]
MKTSVVMATYNGEKFLLEQLDSLKNQTLKIDEVIICDDGSKDNTVEIIEKYIKDNNLLDSWKIIVNEKNLGYGNNFHKAMTLATGDYIFFSDQDDIWLSQKIEEMVDIMEKNPKIQLLCTDYEPFACEEGAPGVPNNIMEKMTNDSSLEFIELNKKNIYIASLGCDMCIRKSFRDKAEPFWIEGWAHDDYVWKMSQVLDGCFVYHKALIKRRLHSSNVSMHKMHKKDIRVKFLKELADANASMLKFAKHEKINPQKIKFIARTVKANRLRKELVEKRKLLNAISLLGYLDCYQYKKAYLTEIAISLNAV